MLLQLILVKGWIYSANEVDTSANGEGVIDNVVVNIVNQNFEDECELRFEEVSIYKDTGGTTVVDVTEGENSPETG